jgi:uncharacterized protein (DUF1800 family)
MPGPNRTHSRFWMLLLLTASALAGCGGNGEDPEAAEAQETPLVALPASDTAPTASALTVEAKFQEAARLNRQELEAENRDAVIGPAESKAAEGQGTLDSATRKAYSRVIVWRFYNQSTGAHFFTASESERDAVRANTALRHLQYEGPAFETSNQPDAGLSPVFRFYNTQTGVHFYTISEQERDYIGANLRQLNYEGIAYYASKLPGTGLQALHRFFLTARGFHFYSASQGEVDNIRSKLPQYSHEGIAYYVPAGSTLTPSATEASRFLGQSSFGPTDADIRLVQSLGYSGWINDQLNQPLRNRYYDTLLQANANTDPPPSQTTLDNTIYASYITAPDQLRKRVGFALSQIMVAAVDNLNPYQVRMFGGASYLDTLEANAFGSYRELLEAVSRHAAMGQFLTFSNNCKADSKGRLPDENYAREVMQLFSIGLLTLNTDGTARMPLQETYTQDDVSQLARVFTGFRWDRPTGTANTDPAFWRKAMVVDTKCQETGSKVFLGTTIAAGKGANESLELAINQLAGHANVGPFIGKQLIQRLVTSNPSPAYVQRVATVFNNNGAGVRGDMKAVIRAILLDADARSAAKITDPQWGKLREPVVRLMHWARSTRATSQDGKWAFGDLRSPSTRLGQAPLHAPSVFNFYRPGYVPPTTSIADAGLVAPEFQITNEASTIGYINYLQDVIDGKHGTRNTGVISSTYAHELDLPVDQLIGRLDLLFTHGQLTPQTRSAIASALGTMGASTNALKLLRVKAAVLLIMASPEYLAQK